LLRTVLQQALTRDCDFLSSIVLIDRMSHLLGSATGQMAMSILEGAVWAGDPATARDTIDLLGEHLVGSHVANVYRQLLDALAENTLPDTPIPSATQPRA